MAAIIDNRPFGAEGARYSYPQKRTALDPIAHAVMSALGTSSKHMDGILSLYIESHSQQKYSTISKDEKFKMVAQLAPADFLRQLDSFCYKFPNDSGLENGLIFHGIINEIKTTKEKKHRILIVNPPVEFVECLCAYPWPYGYKITVCMLNALITKIYNKNQQKSELNFISIDKLTGVGVYTYAVVFATKLEQAQILPMLDNVFLAASTAKKIHILLPTAYLSGSNSAAMKTYLFHNCHLEHVMVIDPNATNVIPKKRCVLTYGKDATEIMIQSATLTDGMMITSRKYKVSDFHMMTQTKTLHQIFFEVEQLHRKETAPGETTRNKPNTYCLSKWIQLEYRIERRKQNKFRVVAFYKSVGDKAQRRRNLRGRGKRIGKEFYSKDMSSETDIIPFVQSVLWNKEMIDVIRKDILTNIEKKDLDVITLWYLFRSKFKEQKQKIYNDKVCVEFLEELEPDDSFFSLPLGEMDKDRIRTALAGCSHYTKRQREEQETIRNQLWLILDQARRMSFCDENPLQELMAEWEKRKKTRSEFRNAMISRGIEDANRDLLNDFVNQDGNEKLAAIVELKQHNGMETTVIGALTLRDIIPKPEFLDFPVINVDKKLPAFGSTPIPFASSDQNRILPVPDQSVALMRYFWKALEKAKAEYIRENQRDKKALKQKDYLSWPLFPQDGYLKTAMAKNALNRLIKTAKSAMGIEKDEVSLVCNVKADLNSYSGDLLRADFQRRLRAQNVSEDDQNYLCCNKVKSLRGEHYRDYLNIGTQTILYRIVNRCANQILAEGISVDTEIRRFELSRGHKKTLEIGGLPQRIEAEIKLEIPASLRLKCVKVNVRNRCAMNIAATFNPR